MQVKINDVHTLSMLLELNSINKITDNLNIELILFALCKYPNNKYK